MKRLNLSLLLFFGFSIAFAQSLEAFEDSNGKTGFKNASGQVVVEPKYDFYDRFSDGLALVNIGSEWSDDPGAPMPEGGKWGYINEKGEEEIPLIYDAADTFSEGMGVFAKLGKDNKYKYGYLNTAGKEIVPAAYNFAEKFENGYGRVNNEYDLVSFFNKDGKLVIPFKYNAAQYLKKDRFRLGINDPNGGTYDYLYGLADKNGKLLTEIKYSYIREFESDITPANTGHGAETLNGFLDIEGKEVIPVIYSNLDTYPTKEGYRLAKLNDKWGVIDSKGKEVIPFNYENLATNSDYQGKIIAKKDSKTGIINFQNKELLPFKYEGLTILFKDMNILGVKIDGKWGLMDYNGKILVEPQFESMNRPTMDKDEAFARVSLNRKFFHIDRNGNRVE